MKKKASSKKEESRREKKNKNIIRKNPNKKESKDLKRFKRLSLHCHLRANREEVPPSSIPNLAVKLFFADDTALCKSGKVGRCGDENVKRI